MRGVTEHKQGLSALAGAIQVAAIALILCVAAHADPAIESSEAPLDTGEPPEITPAELDRAGAVIGTVTIQNGGIFDEDDPREDKALYRLANRIHSTTRPEVIEQQLLFSTGDTFSLQAIEESERILRGNRYIQEAVIEPVSVEDGVVDIRVSTTDVWTLVPKLSFSRSGGENSADIGIRDTNLFGTGMEVELMYETDVDRDSYIAKMVDKNFRDSWYSLKTIIEESSDGHSYELGLAKPFYSLDTHTAHGFSYLDSDRVESLYDHGQLAAQYRHQTNKHEVFAGWSKGLRDGWSKRYMAGLAYDEHRFSAAEMQPLSAFTMPADRQLLYPFVGVELVQNRFSKTANLDQINKTEDRFLGNSVTARLGIASTGLGSDRNAWLASLAARSSIGDPKKSVIFLASEFATRIESGEHTNLTFDVNARYYRRQSEKRVFFAGLSARYGHNLDLDRQVLLGGDSGLRGYPLRYQNGDSRVLLTLEQRLFTDWYPWRLFRVGGAVFFDAGRTWGEGPLPTTNDGFLRDVGVGLRLGNPRSGLGHMAHIDVAFPLDGNDDISDVQFLISMKQSF